MRRQVAALACALLAALVPAAVSTAAGSADPSLTESAVTKSGSGRFADLQVTVGKTRNLGNEAVRVSWQWGGEDPGSHATASDTSWNYNYLSIFQCWGDDPSGPDREQCQFGGQYSATDAGTNRRLQPFVADPDKGWALSRVVSPVDVFGKNVTESVDPREYEDGGYPADGGKPGIVPMRPAPTAAADPVTSIETGVFFDVWGTNEVPLARTNNDGTGQVYVEMQTVYQSQFLGCGARVGEGADVTGRPCWLVVVPRDWTDANGEDVRTRASGSDRALFSSPLSLSNWENRIVFPLDFLPVREACQIGGAERPVVGHESLSAAMSSWQGPLCSAGTGLFYATTTDDIARETAVSALPKLSVVTDPLPPDRKPDEGQLVYAPIAASGVAVSFFIERYYAYNKPAEYRAYNGTRVEELRLNPRLVAKLLTQSYRYSTVTRAPGPPEHLRAAPLSLIDDPEFQALNGFTKPDGTPDPSRDVTHLSNQRESLATIFVTPDASDAVRLLWEWILADEDARAFLDGEPDEHGMTVNPYYKGVSTYLELDVPRADIPRLDGVCVDVSVGLGGGETKPVCPLDAVPYAASFDAAAAQTARGQQLGSQSWVKDPNTGFVKPDKPTPQLIGQRALLAITDTPSTARRGLVAAALRNADGEFVAPTPAAMGAALQQAKKTGTPGVLRVDPDTVDAGGYPLTRFSYAVTNPVPLDQGARDGYADLIAFAATDGQQGGTAPGDLPPGYAPLPKEQQTQAAQAADAIRTAKPPASPDPDPSPGPESSDSTGTDSSGSSGTDSSGSGSGSGSGSDQGSDSTAGANTAPAEDIKADAAPASVTRDAPRRSQGGPFARTPFAAPSALRWLLPALGGLGLVAAAAGPAMLGLGALRSSVPTVSGGNPPPVGPTLPPERTTP